MTREEAQAEARRRWGPTGWASHDYVHAGVGACLVGSDHPTGPQVTFVRGENVQENPTYEAAFADADARAAREGGKP